MRILNFWRPHHELGDIGRLDVLGDCHHSDCEGMRMKGEFMKTFSRICIKDFSIKDRIGQCFELKRGKEYITSPEKDGEVMIYDKFWVKVPINIFAGEIEFTS